MISVSFMEEAAPLSPVPYVTSNTSISLYKQTPGLGSDPLFTNLTASHQSDQHPCTMVNLLIVSPKGDIRVNKAATLTAEGLAKALRKPTPPTVIGTWIVDDGAVELTLWGWRTAYSASIKAGVFVFPAPHKKLTLYGDALLTATKGGKPWDLSVDAWIAHSAEIEEAEDDGGAVAATPAGAATVDADSDAEGDEEDDEFDEEDDVDDAGEEVAEDEEELEEEEDEPDAEEEEEEAEEEEGDDDCYDSDDGGGGGKRRAPRRRAMAAPEFRRMEMGLRARIKMPAPAGKRAPKWQTAPELEPEL